MNVPAKFEVRIALSVPELIGGSQKIRGNPWLCPHSLSPQILYAYHTDYLFIYVQSFSRDFRLEFRVRVANLQSREKDRRRGSEMVLPKRALMSFCRPSVV